MTSEYGTPLSPEQIEEKKRLDVKTKFYLRLPPAYIPFFQAMAEDYYQRSKIAEPSIGLLAKTCLITAGNAWNRMQIQLMNKENERRNQQQQFQPKPQPPRYQKRVAPKTQQQIEDELIEQTLLQPAQEGMRLVPKSQSQFNNNNTQQAPPPQFYAANNAAEYDDYGEEGEY